MTKIDMKKTKKRQDILDSAYQMFTTVGFSKTTILGIARKASVGKGTFYLYFDSKEDVRNELIYLKTSELLEGAIAKLEESAGGKGSSKGSPDEIVEGFIFVADYILTYLSKDLTLLKFISKNLTWGLFFSSNHPDTRPENVINFKEFITRILEQYNITLKNPDLLIFTIIEMVNSTCYSVLMNDDPVPFEQYKPYLYHCIRLLVRDAIVE